MQDMHAAVAELTVVDAHFPATQSMQSLLLEAGDVVEQLIGSFGTQQDWRKVKLVKYCQNGTWVVRPEFAEATCCGCGKGDVKNVHSDDLRVMKANNQQKNNENAPLMSNE